MNSPEWFSRKRYPHIGFPVQGDEAKIVCNYVLNRKNIERHSFSPFIRKEIVSYPFRYDEEKGRKVRIRKVRDITYASHIDSVVFSYYADQLGKKYEGWVEENNLGDVVVAYRKIRCDEGSGNKCNIHIAGDVFSYVKRILLKEAVSLVTFDIKSFFDNLDHSILKAKWKKIMGETNMPKDEYAVFKNATNYTYVHDCDLFSLFREKIWCKSVHGMKRQKAIKNISYMRGRNAIAFCKREDIPIIARSGFLKKNKIGKGIPQGLPVSAVLANIYMMDFDVTVSSHLKELGGIYKRYSDDIVVVCSTKDAPTIRDYIIEEIKKYKLEIQPQKTNLYNLRKEKDRVICSHETKGENKKIEYLGFSFDGERVLLKSSGIGKYYLKMRRAKRRHKHWAISINNETNGYVFQHPMFKRFSLAGANRHFIRKKTKKGFVKTKYKTYGNFLSYVNKAASVLGEPMIRNQMRRNLNKLNESFKEIKMDVSSVLMAKELSGS